MLLTQGINFTVCWLSFENGSCPTLDYLTTLSNTDAACFLSVVDGMSKLQDSNNLRPPAIRPLKGKAKGAFELRVIAGNSRHYARLPLIYSPQLEVIFLFGETKKGIKPPPGFIARTAKYKQLITEGGAGYAAIDFTQFSE